MTKNDFTSFELNLISMYDPGTDSRTGLISALQDILETLIPYESDYAGELEIIIEKLEEMTDQEFEVFQLDMSITEDDIAFYESLWDDDESTDDVPDWLYYDDAEEE